MGGGGEGRGEGTAELGSGPGIVNILATIGTSVYYM